MKDNGSDGGAPPAALSLVSDYGEHGAACGYCGRKAGGPSRSHGMMAERLSVEAYQALLDRCGGEEGRCKGLPLRVLRR